MSRYRGPSNRTWRFGPWVAASAGAAAGVALAGGASAPLGMADLHTGWPVLPRLWRLAIAELSERMAAVASVTLSVALTIVFAVLAAGLASRVLPGAPAASTALLASLLAPLAVPPAALSLALLPAIAALGVAGSLSGFALRRRPASLLGAGGWLMLAVLGGHDFPLLIAACLIFVLLAGATDTLAAVTLTLLAATGWALALALLVNLVSIGSLLPATAAPPTVSAAATVSPALAAAIACCAMLALLRPDTMLAGPAAIISLVAVVDVLVPAADERVAVAGTSILAVLVVAAACGAQAIRWSVNRAAPAIRPPGHRV